MYSHVLYILEKDTFSYAVCKFLAEVRKVEDGSEYPGCTLYHLVVSLQKYLSEKGKNWKLIEGPEFRDVCNVLDNLMKQQAKYNIGNIVRQTQMISMHHEELMWSKGVLGEDSPDKLRSTVLFLIGINIG